MPDAGSSENVLLLSFYTENRFSVFELQTMGIDASSYVQLIEKKL